MTKDLLLEIGTEEIPARFFEPALKQMAELAAAALQANQLPYGEIKTYGTPRRLTLLVTNLPEKQADRQTEVKGPAKKAAYDESGQPTKALLGFCKGQGVSVENLMEKELNGALYIYANKEIKGQDTACLLPSILEELVHKIYFPKPMRWGYGEMRFARPIHWLVALLGTDILSLRIAGITAGRESRGHRFLGKQQVIIADPQSYIDALRQEKVLVDQEERKALIWQQVQEAAAACGGEVKADGELLTEVTFLLEWPTALVGSFAESYLSMPVEMIITPMREHQRYFPVYKKDGSLLPYFIAVRNGDANHLDIVRAGNEKVLLARLADAAFFWQEDCEKPLAENAARLENIVFHEKLGTLAEKVSRIRQLAAYIAQTLSYNEAEVAYTDRAVTLMKCDLVSHAVFEFTELQGIMGKYYARVSQEPEEVAVAIEEQYLPRFAGDELPQTKAGIALALADRLDSIIGFLGLDMQPTGSQDPFALRRQAIGICQIIVRHNLPLSLEDLARQAYAGYAGVSLILDETTTCQNFLGFMKQRLDNSLSEEGVAYDVINAILAGDIRFPAACYRKAKALAAFRSNAEFREMMAGFKRAANITKDQPPMTIQPAAFTEKVEENLADAIGVAAQAAAQADVAQDYQGVLSALATLRKPVDAFLTDVMVMVDDATVKANRIGLLQKVVAIASHIGDLSQLVD